LLGMGLVVDGTVRAGLCAGMLRRSRAVTALAAVTFTALAIDGLFFAGPKPALLQFVTVLANGIVAVVADIDAYRLFITDERAKRCRMLIARVMSRRRDV